MEKGNGTFIIDGKKHSVKDGDAMLIPSHAEHNIINTSKTDNLKLYTIYTQPNHKDGVVAATKEKAEAMKEYFDGRVTE